MKRVNVGAKNYFQEIRVRNIGIYHNRFYPILQPSRHLIEFNLSSYIHSEKMRSYFWIGKTN